MKVIKLKINVIREIFATNFVTRKPPYHWVSDKFFNPPQHFLYFHIDGKRTVGINDQLYNLQSGDMVFFYGKGSFHSLTPETNYRAMNISFSMDNQDSLLTKENKNEKAFLYLPFIYSAKINSSIHFLFEKIVYSFISSSSLKNRNASFLLSQLLIETAENFEQKSGNISTSIDTVICLMEQNPGENWSLDKLASKANMSRATLTRRFRKATGKSIQHFQMDLKLKYAQYIMQNNPEIKVKEVAAMLNFYDEYHFSKTFKRSFNISPLHFKKKLK